MAGGGDDDRGHREGGWWPEDEGPDGGRDKPARAGEEDGEKRRVPRGLSSPGHKRSSGRYSAFVGIAFVALIAIALLNLIGGDDDSGILGAGYGEEGLPLPGFAVPDALAGVEEADANVAQDDCESSRNPCPADEVRTPACEIDVAGALRVCDLFDRPLALSFWFTRGGDCLTTQDAFDEVSRSYGDRVGFLSVNVRDDPASVADIARERGWSVPVGYDRDGAVSNLYRVGVCPTIVLAYPGGILHEAGIGDADAAELGERLDGLLAATRKREDAVR